MTGSDDLFVAISSVCFWQPKTVCWSSSKAMLILLLCKRSNTNYSYLHAHPEIWLFFVFLIHFFKWTSPRTDFLKYRRLPDNVLRKWRQDVEAGTWVLQNKIIPNPIASGLALKCHTFWMYIYIYTGLLSYFLVCAAISDKMFFLLVNWGL